MTSSAAPARRAIELCPSCGSRAATPWLRANDFDLVHCATCSHRYATEVLAADWLAGAYYGETDQDLSDRGDHSKRARFLEYEALIRAHSIWPGRVLDVGCNAGELLRLFREKGWQIAGVETSDRAAHHARQVLGAQIWCGPAETCPPDGECFDLITMTHVLEHIVAPRPLLQRLRSLLRPAGWLLVEVPNANDWLLRCWRGTYRPLCPGDHVSFFDEGSLRGLLEAAGFEVLAVRSPTHARDIAYPSLLSALDWARRVLRPTRPANTVAGGVASQVRYRGRFRAPLRAAFDRVLDTCDPAIVALTGAQDRRRSGPVLVMLARARVGQ